MARIFLAGHETGDLSEWDWQCGAKVVAALAGMDGAYSLDLQSGSEYPHVMKSLGGNKTELYTYFLLRRVSSSAYSPIIIHYFASDEGDAGFAMLDTTNYRFTFNTYYGGTTVATGTTTIAVNTTYRVEIYFKPSTAADGRIVLKINGVTEIDFTGITSTKTNVATLGFGNCRKHAYVNHNCHYDNIIVDDANWITLEGEQPHRLSTLVPAANGAEGDLTVCTPPNIDDDQAKWLFESLDLGNDEKGNADLTAYNTPTADTSDFQQGAACVQLVRASSQYFKVLDSALPSGFPLKSGEANTVFTLTFWYKPDTLPANLVYHYIFNKGVSGDYSFYASTYNSKLRLGWGWAASSITAWDVITLTADQWYFIALIIDGPNKAWKVRLYDAAAATTTNYYGSTAAGVLRSSACDLHIGADNSGGNTLDGKLDCMRLHPYLLSYEVIDLLRQYRTTFEKYEVARIAPPNDSIFLKGHTDTDIQTFGMQDLVGSVESVKCVRVSARNFLTGVPAAKNVAPVVRLSGTNYLGTAVQAPGWLKPEANHKLWETNPNTSSAWTKDDVDGMECGAKLTA